MEGESNKGIRVKAQEGFQMNYLSSPADIVIGGGSAGGGKTYALLLDACRYTHIKGFSGVIFRRITPQIRNAGGLWETSENLFALLGAEPNETLLRWDFPGGQSMKFHHLEHEKNKFDHQGAQYAFIGFDELTQFTEGQFFYLLTRNRSMSGVKPCIRATCNPDPDSWVAKFIEWWIDPNTGFPIPERDGIVRYFTKDGGKIIWGDTPEEVVEKCPHIFGMKEFKDHNKADLIKSATFIRGDVYGNKKLLEKDPSYLANLLSQDEILRKQLLDGNWKVSQDDMALCDYQRVDDLFSNIVTEYELDENGEIVLDEGKKVEKKPNYYVTCDAARFGRDLAVVKTWKGFFVEKVAIFNKSKTSDLVEYIESERQRRSISKSNCLVDQDGVGGGVVDEGGYAGFSGGASVEKDPKTKIKENYKNLKTQCFYRFARRINAAEVAITDDNYYVNGTKTDIVTINGEPHKIQVLIKADLRCFKRKDPDNEGKKMMNTKEEQKNILGGRSPDFGDTIMIREFFELKRSKSFVFKQLS